MTSGQLTPSYDFWSCNHLWLTMMNVPTKFGANIIIQSGNIDIFLNLVWQPPPSWIFASSKCGKLHLDGSLVLNL